MSGSGDVGGDDLDRFEQRQAGLDAANDDVDGVRQRLEKVLFAAFLEKAQPQRGRPKPAANASPMAASSPPPNSIAPAKTAAPRTPETIMNFWVDQSRPACVRRTAERHLLFLLPARLEILQRAFDLFAARALALVGLARGRFRFRDRCAAMLGLFLARQQGIEEHPCQAADGGGGEKGQCERLHVHGRLPQTSTMTSAASSAAASRFSSP